MIPVGAIFRHRIRFGWSRPTALVHLLGHEISGGKIDAWLGPA